MKFARTRTKSGGITIEIETAKGPGYSKLINTGTTDMAEAKQLAKECNVSTIESLSKAGALSRELIRKLTIGGNITLLQAADEWGKWLDEMAASARTADNHRMYVRAFIKHLKNGDTRKLYTISELDLSKWVNADDGTKLATRKVRVAALRSFFKYCSIRQYLNPDPARDLRVKLKLLSHDQKETTHKTPFTDEEFQRLLDFITLQILELSGSENWWFQARVKKLKFWYCASLIGRHSGLRLGDICSLEWASLRDPEKMIVWTRKRDRRIEIPVSPELRRGIEAIPPNQQNFCFPDQDKQVRSRTKRAALSVEFGRICERAGAGDHTFHDLRHTLASELHIRGTTIEEIAIALGHRNTSTTQMYVHPGEPIDPGI